jgi:hypothetical protein
MKKIIAVISGLLLVAIVIIKVANAQNTPQEVKKASTETKMDCGKKSSACCAKMTESKTAEVKVCDPAKCKAGKCDTAKCKTSCTGMKTGMKDCDPAKCGGMAKK